MLQNVPKTAQDGFKMAQVSTKTIGKYSIFEQFALVHDCRHIGSNVGQSGLKTASGWHPQGTNMAPNDSKMAPKWHRVASTWSQYGPKMSQDGCKTAPRWSNGINTRSRCLTMSLKQPKMAPISPNSCQNTLENIVFLDTRTWRVIASLLAPVSVNLASTWPLDGTKQAPT